MREIGQRLAVKEGKQGRLARIAPRAIERLGHGHVIRVCCDSRGIREGSLSGYEHNGIRCSSDLRLHDGAGADQAVLGVTECPAHSFIGGKESNLIAGLKTKASQGNELKGSAECGMAANCKQIMLTRCDARHSDAQSATRVLGIVAGDRQSSGRIDLADGSAVYEVASDGAVSAEKCTGINDSLRAGN